MRLAVSALAWLPDEHDTALKLLRSSGIRLVELIPGRIQKSDQELKKLREHDLEAIAFQALLYGTDGLHLFQSLEQRTALAKHLKKCAQLAQQLGVKNLIFGSPQNRWINQNQLSFADAETIALDFFTELNPFLKEHDVTLCLEPNPVVYNCNFLVTTQETSLFIQKLSASNIQVNLDLGTVTLNQENLNELLSSYSLHIAHIHLSAAYLAPPITGDLIENSLHEKFARILKTNFYRLKASCISIEMKRPEAGLKTLAEIIRKAQGIYGNL